MDTSGNGGTGASKTSEESRKSNGPSGPNGPMGSDGPKAARGTTAARARRVALLCAAAALAVGGAVPASASVARARTAPVVDLDEPVVVDCGSQGQVRPQDFLLACGDGNSRLVGLDWNTWGAKTATAVGTDMVNDCRPYCAAGRFRPFPVEVTLANPKPWPAHPEMSRFTTVRLLYPKTVPAPIPKDVTYKIVYGPNDSLP
ncbi:hypothetical protein AB0P15_13305 [Streptomyces sp. NPDC087917]|uniref:hypothetical protein n=1 Tax=Streptomyces sp. NPDC087917 TaxID=3155060 RepID=UPI0034200C3B